MNISGYIPSRNRTQVAFPERSFDEMSLGPSLLMKREEEQDKSISDISTDISNNSYYLDADDKNVAPIVESLQKEAEVLANKAATRGYDPMLAGEVVAFRRKYQKALSQNEPWGKAVINYKDATAQWKQWDEAHKNDPQEFRQKAKRHFFGQYQGAVDDETPGQLRGFDAGSLPNYYDVNKDIREALKDATGKLGQVVGSEGSSIKIDMSSGIPRLRVFNSNYGQYMDNLQPLLAGAQALMDDFSGAYGADTDRARFAKVQGITPEYLANTVANLTQSQRDAYHSQLPSSNGSYQGLPDGEDGGLKPKFIGSPIAPQGGSLIPKDIESLDASPYKDVADSWAIEEAGKLGLKVTSYDELKKLTEETTKKSSTSYGATGMPFEYGNYVPSEESKKAKKVIEAIDTRVKNQTDPILPTFTINRMAAASKKSVDEINGLKKAFNETVQEERSKFLGVNKTHQKAFESITKDMKIKGFAMNPKRDKAGLILEIEGLDDKDKTVNTTVYLNPAQNDLENIIYNYLGQMDFDIYRQYIRQKTGQILDKEGNIVGTEEIQ